MAMFDDMTPGGPASAATSAPGGAPSGVSPNPNNSAKIPEAQAGYMELTGAQKDGDCSKVDVQGGVSLDRGCCNEFQPQDEQTDTFSCGNCKYGSESQTPNEAAGATPQEQPATDHPLQQLRAKPRRMAG
jgi:hypothetical protein